MVGRRCCAAPMFGLRSTAALPESGVAEILSRSRKVRTQIPNRIKMVAVCQDWPAARTGAKGRRLPQGRAGAGLASPAGTGAGAILFAN